MSDKEIFLFTQAVLALVVAVGGALMVYLNALPSDLYAGIIGVILGYYFGGVSPVTPNGEARKR